jgi:two-component system OmpR family response regulator
VKNHPQSLALPRKSPAVLRVLIVDDNRDTREMYSESLRADGFELRTASNGKDAIRAARTFLPCVIVTDLRLDGRIDGVELIRQLRADHRTEEIRIIMLTGAVFGEERERAEASGIDAFVVKPCLPDTLASEIRRVSRQPAGVL